MLILEDSVELPAQPSAVYDWFRDLPDNYRDWHPDHVSCRYIKGNPLEVGSVLSVEEYLHGQLHELRLILTSIEPNACIGYKIAPGLHGGFRFTPTESGTKLEAKLYIGWRAPGIGRGVDYVVARLFATRIAELRGHMREESQNLLDLFNTWAKT
jgi:hypothetical protein